MIQRETWWVAEGAPQPKQRLIAFGPAGAGPSFFRGWADALGRSTQVCAVHLPGRESRLREAPFQDLERCVHELADVLKPLLLADDTKWAFYGHSLGSLIAWRLSHHLRRLGKALPSALIVSGRRPPFVPQSKPLLSPLSDEELWNKLHAMGGVPDRVHAETELRDLLLPGVRADLLIAESGETPAMGNPLPLPVTAIHGEDDEMSDAREMEAWKQATSAAFALHVVKGGHFAMTSHPTEFLKPIQLALDSVNA